MQSHPVNCSSTAWQGGRRLGCLSYHLVFDPLHGAGAEPERACCLEDARPIAQGSPYAPLYCKGYLRASECLPLCPCPRKPRVDSLPDHRALKLCEYPEHLEHRLASWRGGIEALFAIADAGGEGEIRYFGEVDASLESRRLILKLASKYEQLYFCYGAGPTGYGLHRLITKLGHSCTVAAPSLIPASRATG
jgi:hypothetical protein